MIKLILSDLDDTLIRFGLPHITRYALDAIHAAQDEGVHFGPCTGRIHRDLGWMFDEDERAYATGVNVNGQDVYLDGELIFEKPLDAEALDRAARAIAGEYGPAARVGTVLQESESIAIGISMADVAAHPQEFHRISRVSAHVPEGTWVKANVRVVGDRAHSLQVRDLVASLCPEFDFIYPNPRGSLFDVLPHGWDKAKGADVLRPALGIQKDEVCFFGDAANDLAMMHAFPNAVAVSNAADEVSDFARWHIGSTSDDAVADAIWDIALAAQEGRMPLFMSPVDNLGALGLRASGSRGLDRFR